MTHGRSKDREEENEEQERPYSSYEQKITVRALHFYISGEIEEPRHYTEMVHQIRAALPNEAIHIHLNTPGGRIDSGVQIINAIKASQGHVVTHLEGEVCSMGAVLFLAGDEMVVYDNCLMMFHNYSGGSFGKGHELKASVDAADRWYTTLLADICLPFLSEDELDRIIKGEDLWMQSNEIGPRLQNMTEILAKQAAEAEAEEKGETVKRPAKKKAAPKKKES